MQARNSSLLSGFTEIVTFKQYFFSDWIGKFSAGKPKTDLPLIQCDTNEEYLNVWTETMASNSKNQSIIFIFIFYVRVSVKRMTANINGTPCVEESRAGQQYLQWQTPKNYEFASKPSKSFKIALYFSEY
jgi:hypothetical protein